ncbi:hypothetical protein OSB04_007308 [Centaurea solstitialis]|uniref:WRKY domain-containing protein n=1 Tax=Centaurea solstitialis TaxID=347529 RepID=A0AA38U466_9ASTR|nr:hypothetical protein OSB04_007308 [Centaurea solstitialis]
MAEMNGGSAAAPPQPPQPPPSSRRVPPMIAVPPASSFENLFTGGPGGGGAASRRRHGFSGVANPGASVFEVEDCSSSKQVDSEKKLGGFKQNRPMDLVIAQSPTGFMFPSMFSPSGLLNSPGFFSPLQSPFGMSHQQALAHVTAQAAMSQSYFNHAQPANQSSEEEPQLVTAKSDLDDSQIGSPDDLSVSQSDVSEPHHVISVSSDTNDGYNWRKYGQKQVKASEHPRSYYKCTHANCPVKKKVGQSLDGHISDIVYKGQHNHEPPVLSKHAREGADVNKRNHSQSETCVVEETSAVRAQGSNQLMRIDDPDDEPNPKRRNTDVGPVHVPVPAPVPVPVPVESTSSHKMVAEPKIVVQTRSEVDLLDDGFKWRKYGQKVVKGNTNPRSYYKCTYAGCNVRKHVERAPSDPKSVVTTYEGKHNHDIPVSRHRSYNSNNGGGGGNAKSEKGSATKPSQRKETKFGNNERPVLLQMKEEKISA